MLIQKLNENKKHILKILEKVNKDIRNPKMRDLDIIFTEINELRKIYPLFITFDPNNIHFFFEQKISADDFDNFTKAYDDILTEAGWIVKDIKGKNIIYSKEGYNDLTLCIDSWVCETITTGKMIKETKQDCSFIIS